MKEIIDKLKTLLAGRWRGGLYLCGVDGYKEHKALLMKLKIELLTSESIVNTFRLGAAMLL